VDVVIGVDTLADRLNISLEFLIPLVAKYASLLLEVGSVSVAGYCPAYVGVQFTADPTIVAKAIRQNPQVLGRLGAVARAILAHTKRSRGNQSRVMLGDVTACARTTVSVVGQTLDAMAGQGWLQIMPLSNDDLNGGIFLTMWSDTSTLTPETAGQVRRDLQRFAETVRDREQASITLVEKTLASASLMSWMLAKDAKPQLDGEFDVRPALMAHYEVDPTSLYDGGTQTQGEGGSQGEASSSNETAVPKEAAWLRADLASLLRSMPEFRHSPLNLARILQGVSSPRYPSNVWGQHKLWGKQRGLEFVHVVAEARRVCAQEATAAASGETTTTSR
jgi:hypothetical protein